MAAFNKKSQEYQEIICNSKSPSKKIIRSFGIKKKSGRASRSRQETNNSPNQYGSNYSKSSWNKHRNRNKTRSKMQNKKQKKRNNQN